MSFSADWLDLREPADLSARDEGLLAAARGYAGRGLVLDLGCGTGATRRAFGESDAKWRMLDLDPALLAVAAERAGAGVKVVAGDLRDVDRLPLEGVRLVTESALLDLVSTAWVEALAGRLGAAGVGFYAALSYDGTMGWKPALDGDAAARAAFNRHQRRDKGFGPALGPGAAAVTGDAFEQCGYRVQTAESPWRLGPGRLQAALIAGVAAAAQEAGMAGASGWGQARRAASGSGCTVGHIDLLALPAGASAQSKTTSESRP